MSKEAVSIFDILREQGVLKEAEGEDDNNDTSAEASTTDNNEAYTNE